MERENWSVYLLHSSKKGVLKDQLFSYFLLFLHMRGSLPFTNKMGVSVHSLFWVSLDWVMNGSLWWYPESFTIRFDDFTDRKGFVMMILWHMKDLTEIVNCIFVTLVRIYGSLHLVEAFSIPTLWFSLVS